MESVSGDAKSKAQVASTAWGLMVGSALLVGQYTVPAALPDGLGIMNPSL